MSGNSKERPYFSWLLVITFFAGAASEVPSVAGGGDVAVATGVVSEGGVSVAVATDVSEGGGEGSTVLDSAVDWQKVTNGDLVTEGEKELVVDRRSAVIRPFIVVFCLVIEEVVGGSV